MEDLSLHILDVAENAVRAGAKKIQIELCEDEEKDRLTINIKDDGKGMDTETVQKALNPFFTTKTGKRVGLGLSLLSQAAEQTSGKVTIESHQGKGTCVTAFFKLSHPDMTPLGNMFETMRALIVGNPGLRFIYDYRKGDDTFHFDSFNPDNS